MNDYTQKYTFELWQRNDVRLVELTKYMQNVSYTRTRNEAEELSFSIDIKALEDFAATLNLHPRALLEPYVTNIKVKRNDVYLFGVEVVDIDIKLAESGTTATVKCQGYLNLLATRYVKASYDLVEAGEICRDLIRQTQLVDNGDLGITFNPEQYSTNIERVRNYDGKNDIKAYLQNMTSLETGNFDFYFDHDRQFTIVEQLGAERDLELRYGDGSIIEIDIPRSGINLFNFYYGIGSGFGDEALQTTKFDSESMTIYGRREKIFTQSDVSLIGTLEENTESELIYSKDLIELPSLVVSGAIFDLNIYGVGDIFRVVVDNHPFISLDGYYITEKISVDLDENHAEKITLTVDEVL